MSTRHQGSQFRLSVGAAVFVLFAGVILHTAPPAPKQPYTTWSDYGGGADGMQCSALTQIKDTGNILWEKEIESGPEGIPSVYEAGGRQYIAFAARTGPIFDNIGRPSTAWVPGRTEAQGCYVFALPK